MLFAQNHLAVFRTAAIGTIGAGRIDIIAEQLFPHFYDHPFVQVVLFVQSGASCALFIEIVGISICVIRINIISVCVYHFRFSPF